MNTISDRISRQFRRVPGEFLLRRVLKSHRIRWVFQCETRFCDMALLGFPADVAASPATLPSEGWKRQGRRETPGAATVECTSGFDRSTKPGCSCTRRDAPIRGERRRI